MNAALEAFAGLAWLVSLVLDVAAAGYCYRITRITGGFRAWWLMIAFAILFAVSSFTSVSYSVVTSAASGASSAPAISNVATFDVGLNLLLSVLLFTCMMELFRVFRRQQG